MWLYMALVMTPLMLLQLGEDQPVPRSGNYEVDQYDEVIRLWSRRLYLAWRSHLIMNFNRLRGMNIWRRA